MDVIYVGPTWLSMGSFDKKKHNAKKFFGVKKELQTYIFVFNFRIFVFSFSALKSMNND